MNPVRARCEKISDVAVERVLTLTLENCPRDGTHWSTRSLATHSFAMIRSFARCSLYQLLSKDVKGSPTFWTKAKYGKMSIEGRDPVNTETPH
jgi:hypothetical protein